MKKAQGLPITTVILATLGLLVLVLLFAIVTGRLAIFGKGLKTCDTCIPATQCELIEGAFALPGDWLDKTGAKCEGGRVCCSAPKPPT